MKVDDEVFIMRDGVHTDIGVNQLFAQAFEARHGQAVVHIGYFFGCYLAAQFIGMSACMVLLCNEFDPAQAITRRRKCGPKVLEFVTDPDDRYGKFSG